MRSRPPVALLPRRRLADIPFGAMRGRRRGSGHDLAGARPYVSGDDVRAIDHRASARLASARGADELVVREFIAEEATRVVIVLDRRPAMGLETDGAPWLSKRQAASEAVQVIVDSARAARALLGYLDDVADEDESAWTWWPPDGRSDPQRLLAHARGDCSFRGGQATLADALSQLLRWPRALPPGSFLFLLSDFLVPPGRALWQQGLARGWDLVPVVIQDPVWERSFPDVAGVTLPVLDPASGVAVPVRLTADEVAARRHENEERARRLTAEMAAIGLDWVSIDSAAPPDVRRSFERWSEARRAGARLGR